MKKASRSVAVSFALTVSIILGACGGPEASSVGQCDVAGLTEDPQFQTQVIEINDYCPIPSGTCSVPGVTCIGHNSVDNIYSYGAVIITSAEGWAHMSGDGTSYASCTSSQIEPDWNNSTVVLASITASGCDAASALPFIQVDAEGRPHLEVRLDFNYCSDCDCLAIATTEVIIHSKLEPTVCLRANPS